MSHTRELWALEEREHKKFEDFHVNTPSDKSQVIRIKNGVFFVFLTSTYVAMGYWVGTAPQSIALSEIVSRTDPSKSVSHKHALQVDLPFAADDLERPPKYTGNQKNADHFELLSAENHSEPLKPFLSSRATKYGKKQNLDMPKSARDATELSITSGGARSRLVHGLTPLTKPFLQKQVRRQMERWTNYVLDVTRQWV